MDKQELKSSANAKPLTLSDQEIERRKNWLELGKDDEAIVRAEIDGLLISQIDDLISTMYKHFLSFEETAGFFSDPAVLKRAQSAQKVYFQRLAKGDYGSDYVENRLGVGSTHHRIDLDPKWYLGAYNQVIAWLLPALKKRFSADPDKVFKPLASFLKVVFFDMGLAIESYIRAKEISIRRHRDALNELETERKITKNILENAPLGLVSLNEDLVCTECNREFLKIVERDSASELIGLSIFDIVPGISKVSFQRVLESGEPCQRSADPIALGSGSSREEAFWDWATWPVKDESGQTTGLVAMFSNATDRVQLQQQREDFVATLTHDLKTPVLATNRAVQFLLDGDFGPISEPQQEILDTILQSNRSLYALVQTLLDVYRFDSGVKTLSLRSCSLSALILTLVSEVMPLAKSKHIELQVKVPESATEVECDEGEMRRVVQNLLDNALKYTSAGGWIKVEMSQNGQTSLFSVSDSGRGISEENLPKLFQRFWKTGPTGRYYASTGLGLYLCRRIVEAHGGKIWCKSELGKGSTFSVEL